MADKKPRRRWRRLLTIFVAVPIAAVVADLLFGLIGFFQWSPLNCWHEDMDIRTGRIRYTRYLFRCKVNERVMDSELTKALPPDAVECVEPDWHRVNTFSPGVHYSPHYRYHGAIHTIRMLKDAWERASFSAEARRRCAETVLELWQSDGGYHMAKRYALAVLDTAFRAGEASAIGVRDLPPVPKD